MKNFLIKQWVSLAQLFLRKHRESNRFLIVSTTALGDTLWATPAIESLRTSFPDASIAVLTSPIGAQVLKHNPHINQLFVLKEPLLHHFFSLWKQLYKERFDTIFLFHASQRLTLPLCALLGASRIIGTSGTNKGLDTLLTHSLPPLKEHEIVRRLKIIEMMGAKITTEKLSFHLNADESLPQRPPARWIALHPGSKDPFKRWPKESFIELGKRLKENIDCELLITGTKEERALMEEITAQIPGAHIDSPGRTLREFAALLNQMDLLISNDTGPVHLACALNRPVIGIYCSTDPSLCGPHQAPHGHVIARRAPCTPCLKRQCRRPFCFLQISPQEVAQSALKIISFKEQK